MKRYLGDSVYGEVIDGMLILTTENGYGPSNTIILEPSVAASLLDMIAPRPATRDVDDK